MAQQQIITKPYVGELQDDDSLFINHDGALRQVKKKDADLASSEEVAAEVAAREAFEAREVAAREAFEESETEAREEFEADVQEQMAEKANVDGYYEEMTVGDAEQLVATQFVEDNEPYLFRPTGGSSDVGNRAYLDKIIGGTVAWNQLSSVQKIRETRTLQGVSFTNNGDGSVTLSGTATGKVTGGIWSNIQIPANHKTLVTYTVGADGVQWQVKSVSNIQGDVVITEGTTYNITFYPQIFDLTQMFGSTIADYIYSLELATAGAGVAWFKNLFPKDYYEYNAGELLSVEGLESHDTVGFNQFDGVWESGYYDTADGAAVASVSWQRNANPIPCLPNTKYCAVQDGGSFGYILFYDADGDYISYASPYGIATVGTVFTTPSNAYQIKFYRQGSNAGRTLNVNFNSSSRNGEYEEYQKHSYPLDNSLTLRGIPKLDSFNNLYYDGDEYESDGTVIRKYGIVDLGTLTWNAPNGSGRTSASAGAKPIPSSTDLMNLICDKYITITARQWYDSTATGIAFCGSGYGTDGNVGIVDPSFIGKTAEEVKTALSGIYLVYELTTPTTEEAEPYQYTQIVDDLGTEEFVSNGFIPASHLTEYPANLRDKLQHLPDLAGMDGTYLIRQTGNQMSLVYMPAVFPEIPTEDGTYTLETVVTGGVATLQWVAK